MGSDERGGRGEVGVKNHGWDHTVKMGCTMWSHRTREVKHPVGCMCMPQQFMHVRLH